MKSLGQLVPNLVGIFIRWFYKSLSTRKKQESQRCQTGWCLFLYVESLLSDIGLREGKFLLVPQNIWWSYILQILVSYFDWTNKTETRRAGTFWLCFF